MLQSPMISCPLKQTNEIDWVQPLKSYIRETYGDDPERYAEECNTLNRLRQDMRGAGKDSTAGRDLLYRYYGQLELLDLRFPVDENHIKISFTWFDAFTQKPTSQFSLAYEKASIIFNISAALSCHATYQDRNDEAGLKAAFHSFQSSAGMYTYINENFLHAPSTDLSRETVKTLITLMLAQAQEVFVEKQIADGKKNGMLAKLTGHAGLLYTQAAEGIQENVAKNIFERLWLHVTQIKANFFSSLAQYYQAMAEDDANSHGVAIARLYVAERESKDAARIANAFPSTVSASSNLSSETRSCLVDMTTRLSVTITEKLAAFNKDNDFIYHQTVPAEASLSVVPKLAAAKAIPVSELYQGQDIQRIIGPDIFQKIVPISVTESASLYDEEKAKLVRAEAENVETANGEMAASLDYLKLPGSLTVLKGGMDQEVTLDDEFRSWCEDLAGHESFDNAFDSLQSDKVTILNLLTTCVKQLDQEESTCEKMRSKYGGDWTQQPSSRLTTTLRSDIRSYRGATDEASNSDARLLHTSRQYESDFDEMRSAGESNEADVLYQRAMLNAGSGRSKNKGGLSSPLSGQPEGNLLDEDFGEHEISVKDQISKVEDLLRRLDLIKRDRMQVLKDLKEKVHNDDISTTLILSKKSMANHEAQLFQAELDKFRPHQQRLLQATHKQNSLMKELTRLYGNLLQDKRVKSEQAKYEHFTRQRNAVLTKYRKVYQAFNDLVGGLVRAQGFYSEMKENVESLEKNVETFVNNRRAEGAQLLAQIERDKQNSVEDQADRERDRLKDIMERISLSPNPTSPNRPSSSRPSVQSRPSQADSNQAFRSPPSSPPFHPNPPSLAYSNGPTMMSPSTSYQNAVSYDSHRSGGLASASNSYNPMTYPYQAPVSQPSQNSHPQYSHHSSQSLPQGYVPPPPPPGPPPNTKGNFGNPVNAQPSELGAFVRQQTPAGHSGNNTQQPQNDPWAGLNAWK